MVTNIAVWYVRLNAADLWHRAPSPGRVAAPCGHPPTARGWPDATRERPARLHCEWCRKAAERVAR